LFCFAGLLVFLLNGITRTIVCVNADSFFVLPEFLEQKIFCLCFIQAKPGSRVATSEELPQKSAAIKACIPG
jgi:hypothetical protein